MMENQVPESHEMRCRVGDGGSRACKGEEYVARFGGQKRARKL